MIEYVDKLVWLVEKAPLALLFLFMLVIIWWGARRLAAREKTIAHLTSVLTRIHAQDSSVLDEATQRVIGVGRGS